jgi:hypothetical protein
MSRRSTPKSSRTRCRSTNRWLKVEARGPKHCTGVSGLTVSGVSTPM